MGVLIYLLKGKMPLPLLHAAAGYAVYHAAQKGNPDWKLAAGCILLANAADLDFIPGILVGQPDLFHHSFTHSYTAAAAAGLIIATAVQLWKKRGFLKTFLISFLAYSTHVALDALMDHGSLPLFWPLTPGKLTSRLAAFRVESIHLGGFDNFVCDRFLSLTCLKRFSTEIMTAGLGGICLFVYSKLKRSLAPSLSYLLQPSGKKIAA